MLPELALLLRTLKQNLVSPLHCVLRLMTHLQAQSTGTANAAFCMCLVVHMLLTNTGRHIIFDYVWQSGMSMEEPHAQLHMLRMHTQTCMLLISPEVFMTGSG